MTLQTRRLNTIGIAREDDAAKGTAVALSTGFTLVVQSGILKPEITYAMLDGLNGVNMQGLQQEIVQKMATLKFSADVKADWIGHILVGLLGTVSSANAGGETLVREHTITTLNSSGNMPAYTLFMLDAIQNDRATYGTVKSLTLKAAPNSLLTADVEIIAQKVEDGSGSAAHATDRHFQGSHGTIKIGAAVTNLAAASGIAFNSIELTIERELHPVFGFTTSAHTDPTEPMNFVGGKLMVRGVVTIPWEAETYRNYFLDGTNKAMRISFQNPTTIGSAEKPEIQIDIAKFYVTKHERPEGGDETDMETIEFEAVYDLDDADMKDVKVILTNEEATTAYTEPA